MVVYTRIHLVIVSIHTPTQGVTTSIMYPAQASQFQSTHPRRVWPFCTFAMCSEYVSIHTPTQGVTIPCPVWRGCIIVSIHTPTQGVTAATIFCSEFNKFQSTHPRRVWLIYHFLHFRTECFNPHTHAGCDDVTVYFSVSAKVSIHTPTQGVTLYNLIERAAIAVSIHTPTQGVTPGAPGVPVSPLVSIHTPTQGVTTRLYLNSGTSSFNPHTHAGCDNRIRKTIDFYYVSIHTPTQGVTFLNWLKAIPARCQSTHPRRVWPGIEYEKKADYVSIHTPTQGVTTVKRHSALNLFVSIHTPTQGVTPRPSRELTI